MRIILNDEYHQVVLLDAVAIVLDMRLPDCGNIAATWGRRGSPARGVGRDPSLSRRSGIK